MIESAMQPGRRPRAVARCTEGPRAAALGLALLSALGGAPSQAAEPRAATADARTGAGAGDRAGDPDADPAPEPPPRDPNELPFLPEPYGQPRRAEERWNPPTVTGRSDRRRVALTIVPSFASFFRARFLGRPDRPTAGVGLGLEADVHLIDPVWLRVLVSHSVHPVNDEFARNDDEMIVQTAAAGLVQATHAGLGLAYGLDLGRVLPLLEVGVGALWMRSPASVTDGQLGGACLSNGACDTGLVCSAASTCEVATSFAAHGGIGLDVMLGDRWSAGAAIRYFALIVAPGNFPVYLTVGARLGARF
jgi:hypothetical protein